ncbi:hypothetical protein [Dolichospermum flos-aquae]|uniref:Uncharacterized protein n=1 Tax=Dolichospermum flos-aquae LEGE 04289 TaxID=1828708 RepID=A0ACC5Q1T7_DOLFA|nr:hypothetical protein [Dolichospermum flos-aquae]MBE9219015.1 hypothetical protein [Dolichospermum flos-aquae LEGE 04289]
MTREQGTGATPRGQVLGNFTFRYLCQFFSVHLFKIGKITLVLSVSYLVDHVMQHFSSSLEQILCSDESNRLISIVTSS